MKQTITFVLLLTCLFINAQQLSERKLEKLYDLNVDTSHLNLDDLTIQKNLNDILTFDRKRKQNKTIAIIYTSLGVSGLALGGAVYSNKDAFLGEIFGGALMVSGAGAVIISVPFWVATRNRKRDRDELIKMFD